jgi:ATP-binding cassette, subfamily C (CFTR/MRP), member 1
MDVWVAGVAAFGILGGAIAVWWLLKKKRSFVVAKNWHFWTKQVWDFCSFQDQSALTRA